MIFKKSYLIYKTKRKTNLQIVLRLESIDIILIKQKVVQATWYIVTGIYKKVTFMILYLEIT